MKAAASGARADGSPKHVVAYVAAGSDVEPHRNLPEALRLLRRRVEVTGVSTFYRTPAVGADGRAIPGRASFVNGVLEVRTALGAAELRSQVLRAIERRLGRRRTADRCAPRPIDLDLVLYGSEVVEGRGWRVPSRDLSRPFVALPLLELAPDVVLPPAGEALSCLWSGATVAAYGMSPDAAVTALLREVLRT